MTNARAIVASPALKFTGAMLALTHAASYFFFSPYLPATLSDKLTQYCWPGLSYCHWTPLLGAAAWKAVLAFYLVLSVATAAAFALEFRRPAAYWLFWSLCIFKVALMSLSYRTMGNYHYIPLILGFSFLMLPQKRKVFLCGLIAVYFFAGLLKLDPEWLSGAALGRLPPMIPAALFQWMLAYVILLEMVFIFGLVSERNHLRVAVLAQLLIFHLFSVIYVGWFYPVVMALLWLAAGALLSEDPKLFREPLGRPAKIVLALFCLAQITPKFWGDRAVLDGRLRLASLNMFDARTHCLSSMLVHRGNTWMDLGIHFGLFGIRVKCDPILYESAAKSICRADRQIFESKVSLYVESKTTTSNSSHNILREPDFCAAEREER